MSSTSMTDGFAAISPPVSGSMGLDQTWGSAMQLEKRLKAESRKRSFWDPEVKNLEGAGRGREEIDRGSETLRGRVCLG